MVSGCQLVLDPKPFEFLKSKQRYNSMSVFILNASPGRAVSPNGMPALPTLNGTVPENVRNRSTVLPARCKPRHDRIPDDFAGLKRSYLAKSNAASL